ncbi:SGNH/GDSL hydrolase family protein [Hymenobacter cellulosivorans]|uniref:SGNH/GDSL hydrolase family protein n=1 Tax=Hymenobacter cellulosivorans TaxID=2932249 RepID=A0ABY4FE62_9BACT|nr:SGNH/GDSL hydrolase family protein [Hymenobacter cellulosivorans]UOQ54406.1 SGNH/GDSL hydrolase family protein [Hymenobacter cellulosivorans]
MNTILFRKYVPFVALLGLGLTACQPDLEDDFKASAGTADFSRYIAVGNSLTAGYSDNGLYLEGQQSSYPNLLAMQFKQVGGGDFVQPLFKAANGSGYLTITGFNADGTPQINPEAKDNNGTYVAPGQFATGRAYTAAGVPLLERYGATDNQNLGVPGIRIADITTASYGRLTGTSNPLTFNSYFERLLPSATDTRSYLDYVKSQVSAVNPTFFTNWLGNNDVLGFASTGGTGAPLTAVPEFTTKYGQMLDALTTGGAKGLVATIPNVTNVPLFTTVPTAAVIAQVSATPIPPALVPVIANLLKLPAGSPLPSGTRFGLYIRTGAGTNREATANDLLLLPARGVINTPSTTSPFPNGIGLVIPNADAPTTAALAASANALASSLVLDAAETKAVVDRTTELNNVIMTAAKAKNLAVFDANAYFTSIARTGVITNGINNTAAFVSGNLFSLDGVHPTPRGYALVANEMIKVINATYGASVPQLNAAAYRGVEFP